MDELPSIFIGSSNEAIDVAREVELQLQHVALPTIWKDGVFGLGSATLETLMNVVEQFDFAAMILSPDDLVESRNSTMASPRDNVLFELGLFMGRLGRNRTFIIHEKDANLKLPSDLAGITVSPYKKRDNLSAALSPTCTPIIKAIRSLKFFEGRASTRLTKASGEMEAVTVNMSSLMRRLIQSRILELQIVERRMPTSERREVEQDRLELEKLLRSTK
jgi:hypothetical protein